MSAQFKNEGGKEVEFMDTSRFDNKMPEHNMTKDDQKRHLDTIANTDPMEYFNLGNMIYEGLTDPSSALRNKFKAKVADIKASEKTQTYEYQGDHNKIEAAMAHAKKIQDR